MIYKIDAENKILGRVASKAAALLCGKHKPDFQYHCDNNDTVEIINAEKIKVSGKKLDDKIYYKHSEWIGHLKKTTLKKLLETKPTKALELAIFGMLPKNKLRPKAMKRLKLK